MYENIMVEFIKVWKNYKMNKLHFDKVQFTKIWIYYYRMYQGWICHRTINWGMKYFVTIEKVTIWQGKIYQGMNKL